MFDNPAFMLYAMECEGDIDTPTGKRNKLIKKLRQRAQWGPVTESEVCQEAVAAGLGILTDEEINNILNEIEVGVY